MEQLHGSSRNRVGPSDNFEYHHTVMSKHEWTFCCRAVCLFLSGLVVGIFGMWVPGQFYFQKHSTDQEIRSNGVGYQYINPLLECSLSEEYLSASNTGPSRRRLADTIDLYQSEGFVDHVSIYFRNLNEGPWVGVNEKEKFSPASLMKVPVMMAMLQKEDEHPGFLQQKLKVDFSTESQVTSYYQSQSNLQNDVEYTLEELMRAMIVYSDNNALYTLVSEKVSSEDFYRLFDDLHIDWPVDDTSDFISVKDYSAFFRVLYNASYLSRASSEYALRLLSESVFTSGLVAGVPEGVRVSHKFGERQTDDGKQVHDCGIVYASSNPYLLCVMTRGDDFEKMTTVISNISKQVYEEMVLKL